MKITFQINYRTVWGEQVVLRIGTKKKAMKHTGNGIWEVSANADVAPAEYSYEVVRDGKTVRTEWESHTLPEGLEGSVAVYDCWHDIPQDAPLHSSAFTDGIFRRLPDKKTARKGSTVLRVSCADVRPGEVLAIAGSVPQLGEWSKPQVMDYLGGCLWQFRTDMKDAAEYKFVILDKKGGNIILWEEGANRRIAPEAGLTTVADLGATSFSSRHWRGAGTAIPVFSLRSEDDFGVGEFHDLKKMADWAQATGQSVLQLLPVNDTTMTGTWQDSYPYNANSTFALHPQFIHLPDAGVETDDEYKALQAELNALPEVDYERVNNEKTRLMHKAFDKTGKKVLASAAYKKFFAANSHWLIPYAAFCTLRDLNGTPDFSKWGEYATYSEEKVAALCRRYKTDVDFHCFIQYHLDRQLTEACEYAHSKGVVLKGDLPIGISRTSADAWLYPALFHLDSQAGAPPDAFSAFGQNWGFPTYNWERMAKDGFAWWKARLGKMNAYFDAFRIDHILGFFRIWEIPYESVHGLLGHFNPALPYTTEELDKMGFNVSDGKYVTPPTYPHVLDKFFGAYSAEVQEKCFKDGKLKAAYATQRKVEAAFAGDGEKETAIREGLMSLLDDVLFVEDPRKKGSWHPRIGAQNTLTYSLLDEYRRNAFNRLYDDFFYRRHNSFWKDSAMSKLPELLRSTGMLACGEDLGMIPDCVPEVMDSLKILSLEIQRMPKSIHETFANPANYPYHSVCTTSTHDMNPLRAWWEEDRAVSAQFYHEVLGGHGDVPYFCEPWICEKIVKQHLDSRAMLTVLPLQDWLSMDGELRFGQPDKERINVPAIPRYYWRYRMHLTLENLIGQEGFNGKVRNMIGASGRSK
ncbi:MAG: 4-alpha-glucanotransferase [Candidatus Cryptobacteroides sp.]